MSCSALTGRGGNGREWKGISIVHVLLALFNPSSHYVSLCIKPFDSPSVATLECFGVLYTGVDHDTILLTLVTYAPCVIT